MKEIKKEQKSQSMKRTKPLESLMLAGLFLSALTLPLIDCRLPGSLGGMRISDFLILVVGAIFAGQYCYQSLVKRKLQPIIWPLGRYWLLFLGAIIVSSALSLWPVDSLKYALKTIVFAYLFYIVLPANLIDSWSKWRWLLGSIVIAGIGSSLVGLWSLTQQNLSDIFFRVQPVALWGHWWLGYNHNLIGEFLVITNLFLLAGRNLITSKKYQRVLDVIFIGCLALTLLTFSRAAWITVGLQFFIWWTLIKSSRQKIGWLLALGLMAIMALPIWLRMENLQVSNFSSTENRVLLLQISVDNFIEHPIIGLGSGQYLRMVGDSLRFTAKYGDPIDSHGIIQKLIAENGLIGLVTYFLLLLVLINYWIKLWQNNKSLESWIIPLVLGAFGGVFFQFFNTSYYKGRVWLPVALTLIAGQLLEYDQKRKQQKSID